jgi:hypothetical protein
MDAAPVLMRGSGAAFGFDLGHKFVGDGLEAGFIFR